MLCGLWERTSVPHFSLPPSIQKHSVPYSHDTPAESGLITTALNLMQPQEGQQASVCPLGMPRISPKGGVPSQSLSGVDWLRPQEGNGGNSPLHLSLRDFPPQPHSCESFSGLPPRSSLFSHPHWPTPFFVHLHHLVSLHSPSWPGLLLQGAPVVFPLCLQLCGNATHHRCWHF